MSEPTGWSRFWRRKLGVVCIAAGVVALVWIGWVLTTKPNEVDGGDLIRLAMCAFAFLAAGFTWVRGRVFDR